MFNFYVKMLINVKKLYGTGHNNMPDSLLDLFENIASVMLDDYDSKSCPRDDLDYDIKVFIDKFSTNGSDVTAKNLAAAMRIPKAFRALMHDSSFGTVKEAFHYALANELSNDLADQNGYVIKDYYIKEEGSENMSGEEDSIVFGFAEPKQVRLFAKNAPKQVLSCAESLINDAHSMGKAITKRFLKKTFDEPMNAYYLSNAFELLNGGFNSDSPLCCYDNGYVRGMPDDFTIKEVKDHPENYAVVELLFTS